MANIWLTSSEAQGNPWQGGSCPKPIPDTLCERQENTLNGTAGTMHTHLHTDLQLGTIQHSSFYVLPCLNLICFQVLVLYY